MTDPVRIYLDHAATSYTARSVTERWYSAIQNAGRHPASRSAARWTRGVSRRSSSGAPGVRRAPGGSDARDLLFRCGVDGRHQLILKGFDLACGPHRRLIDGAQRRRPPRADAPAAGSSSTWWKRTRRAHRRDRARAVVGAARVHARRRLPDASNVTGTDPADRRSRGHRHEAGAYMLVDGAQGRATGLDLATLGVDAYATRATRACSVRRAWACSNFAPGVEPVQLLEAVQRRRLLGVRDPADGAPRRYEGRQPNTPGSRASARPPASWRAR